MAISTHGVHLIYGGTGSSASYDSITLKGLTATYSTGSTYNIGDLAVHSSKLYRCKANSVTGTWDATKWDEIEDKTFCIKDFPDMSNPQPDQVETTTLCDSEHKNIDGLGNLPDELSFTANFDNDLYNLLEGLSAEAHWGIQVGTGAGSPQWVFKATSRMELVGAGVGDALEMRIVLTPKSEITKGNASA